MPKPKQGETESEFVDRCIPIVIQEGTAKDGQQGAAICHSLWDEDKKAMKKNWLNIKASADGKSSIIDISGAIGGGGFFEPDGVTKESISAELKQIGALKHDIIYVNINSLGGDVNDGISIHDILAQNPAKKIVSINGMTASAATIIAMAGNEIKMSDNALFLVHRASTLAMGNINDMNATADDLKNIDNLMANIYVKKTKKPMADVVAQMDLNNGQGEWMTAQEAKDFGFVNEVFEPTSMAASVDDNMLKKFGLPLIPTNKLPKINNEMKTLSEQFDALKALVSEKLGFKAELMEHKLKDGKTIKIEMAGAEPAIGDSVTDEAGNPTPDQSYTLVDETVIKTDADSKISEITKPQPSQADAPTESAEVTALKAEIETIKAEREALKVECDEMKNSVTNIETKMTALAKQITSKGAPNINDATQFRQREAKTGLESSIAEVRELRKKAKKELLTAKK